MSLYNQLLTICQKAKAASRKLASASPEKKNLFFLTLGQLLGEKADAIMQANANDVSLAEQAGMDTARLDRLRLTPRILSQMVEACAWLAKQPDPVGALDTQWQRPNGMLVGKMRIPLGVIGMIYEARPNVTIDAAILCIKAGNAVILRGGKEALQTNIALTGLLREALDKAGLTEDGCQLLQTVDHEAVDILCGMDQYIDVLIPRGGENLIARVCARATMPVLKHYKGVCHIYIDQSADLPMALDIVVNAKTQRPGVCNALECLLVHEKAAAGFLPDLARALTSLGVEVRADDKALPLLGGKAKRLDPADQGREFHALILAVKIVPDMDAAMDYIAEYGSNHTDVICTDNYDNAMRFLRQVDSSMVGVNVSTRFNDGGELGLGAEIGISTSKLHSYGPMGVNELTTTKFVVLGNGQIRK